VQRLDEPLDGAACVAQQPQQQQHAAGECATSTTSTVTTGSVLAPEASDSVAGDAAAGAPSVRGFESGCDSDINPAGELACAGVAMPPAAAAEVDDEDDEEWFDPLLFISRLPPAAPPGALRPGTLLPRRTRACKQKTLVLDLDETLVHSTLDGAPGSEGAHFHFPVHFNGAEHMVHVRMRPHMRDFLERTSELFEVVVFTASQKVYAEKLLNILDPHRRLVRHRIYRDSCVFVDGNYLKVGSCANGRNWFRAPVVYVYVLVEEGIGARLCSLSRSVQTPIRLLACACIRLHSHCDALPSPRFSMPACRHSWVFRRTCRAWAATWPTLQSSTTAPKPSASRWTTESPLSRGTTTTPTQSCCSCCLS
jgi:hypothetical protein